MESRQSVPARPRAKDYVDQLRCQTLRLRLRSRARSTTIFLLSLPARVAAHRQWIIFPYYHHVLDDERRNFGRQLKYMRRFGEFISADDAIEALQNPGGLGGRYFCITFDDGFKNCLTHAMPILLDHACPATFFVSTDYVGVDLDKDWDVAWRFYSRSLSYRLPLDFLSWEDCREMQAAGMTIGSHTCSHARPTDLDPAEVERELSESKARIEQELGSSCDHFACPKGCPVRDFDPNTHPAQVRSAGYRSLLTTRRGLNTSGSDPYSIRREEFLAGEGTFALRYFFSRKRRSA